MVVSGNRVTKHILTKTFSVNFCFRTVSFSFIASVLPSAFNTKAVPAGQTEGHRVKRALIFFSLVCFLFGGFLPVAMATDCTGHLSGEPNPLLQHPGLKIEYVGSPGAKKLIYYFHGGGGNSFSWNDPETERLGELKSEILKRLDSKDHESVAFGFVSLGPFWLLSSNPSPVHKDRSLDVANYHSLLLQLESSRGFEIENRIAIGHSLGALNALELELSFSGTFSAMAFMGPAMFAFDPTGFTSANIVASFKEARDLERVMGIPAVKFARRLAYFIGQSFFAPVFYSSITGRHNYVMSLKPLDLIKALYATAIRPSTWKEVDPVSRIEGLSSHMTNIPPVSISVGEHDLRFGAGAERFSKALGALGYDEAFRVIEGVGHNGPYDHESIAKFVVESLTR